MFLGTLAIYILINVIGFEVPENLKTPLNILVAASPAIFWLIFSWWRERFALQPREQLLSVAIVAGLAANAIGIPLIDQVLTVERWLPSLDSINRIVGYTFTVGIVQEILKYVVVRYMAWPQRLRIRADSVAYCAAAAVGYATVQNLHFVTQNTATVDITAIRAFNTVSLHVATSLVIAYGLAEIRFSKPFILLPSLSVGLAAIIAGFAIPFRAGLSNARLTFGISSTNPILAFGFSTVVIIILYFVFAFLFQTADRIEREAVLRIQSEA